MESSKNPHRAHCSKSQLASLDLAGSVPRRGLTWEAGRTVEASHMYMTMQYRFHLNQLAPAFCIQAPHHWLSASSSSSSSSSSQIRAHTALTSQDGMLQYTGNSDAMVTRSSSPVSLTKLPFPVTHLFLFLFSFGQRVQLPHMLLYQVLFRTLQSIPVCYQQGLFDRRCLSLIQGRGNNTEMICFCLIRPKWSLYWGYGY